jgi:6-hydroxynicotinate 3-monooxygenase
MQIAIVGAGLGGLVAGSMLQRRGHDVRIYEQAPEVQRLGAGINLGPNLMKVMRHVGVEQKLIDIGLEPAAWTSKDFATGNTLFRYPFRDAARKKYGATYLLIHRGDFHAVLSTIVPPGITEFGMRLTDLEERGGKVRLVIANGQERQADIVIGADGINSRVREVLLGPEVPKYTGYVAHRAILPREAAAKLEVAAELTKWWSDAAHRDTHIVIYFLDRAKTELYFVTGVPEPTWKQIGMSSRSASSYSGKKYWSFAHLPASLSPFFSTPTAPWSLAKRSSLIASSMLPVGGSITQRSRPCERSLRSASQRL